MVDGRRNHNNHNNNNNNRFYCKRRRQRQPATTAPAVAGGGEEEEEEEEGEGEEEEEVWHTTNCRTRAFALGGCLYRFLEERRCAALTGVCSISHRLASCCLAKWWRLNFLDLAFAFLKRLLSKVRVERVCIPKRGSKVPVAILSGSVLSIPCLVAGTC